MIHHSDPVACPYIRKKSTFYIKIADVTDADILLSFLSLYFELKCNVFNINIWKYLFSQVKECVFTGNWRSKILLLFFLCMGFNIYDDQHCPFCTFHTGYKQSNRLDTFNTEDHRLVHYISDNFAVSKRIIFIYSNHNILTESCCSVVVYL